MDRHGSDAVLDSDPDLDQHQKIRILIWIRIGINMMPIHSTDPILLGWWCRAERVTSTFLETSQEELQLFAPPLQ